MIKKILNKLQAWAKELNDETNTEGVYLFGSLIHRAGQQFDEKLSDIDIVVCFPKNLENAISRVDWLKTLRARKKALEIDLAKILNRDGKSSICSVVVPTRIEIKAGIHKDCATDFFKRNLFLNLITNVETIGIPGAGTTPPSRGSCP